MWTEWSDCPVTCGGGFRLRIRNCTKPPAQWGGRECKGQSIKRKHCNTHVCPCKLRPVNCPQDKSVLRLLVNQVLVHVIMTISREENVSYPFHKSAKEFTLESSIFMHFREICWTSKWLLEKNHWFLIYRISYNHKMTMKLEEALIIVDENLTVTDSHSSTVTELLKIL